MASDSESGTRSGSFSEVRLPIICTIWTPDQRRQKSILSGRNFGSVTVPICLKKKIFLALGKMPDSVEFQLGKDLTSILFKDYFSIA